MKWFYLGARLVLLPECWDVVSVDHERYLRVRRQGMKDYWVSEDGQRWARTAYAGY